MLRLLHAVLIAGLFAWWVDPATAAVPVRSVSIQSIEIGFGGIYKVGRWTPVAVRIAGGEQPVDAQVLITTPDGDGVPAEFATSDGNPIRILAGQEVTAMRSIKVGRLGSDVTVRLVRDGVEIAKRVFAASELRQPLLSTDGLILAFGSPTGVEDAVRKARRDRSREFAICQVPDTDHAPLDWFAYEAVDWAIVTTSEMTAFERLSDPQSAAFDRWLLLGGRMVFCVGRRGEEVFAADSRLARFSPGRDAEVISQRTTSGLENYASSSERLEIVANERTRRFSVPMTLLSETRGLVESSEVGGPTGRVPTVVRSPYGLGQIVFVSFDPDQSPFTAWQGRASMMARILQISTPGRQEESEQGLRGDQATLLGYQDLVGQLRSALDQFQGVHRLRFSWIAGLLALYVLLIGPSDYLLLKKLNRMHWTWLSFPAVTVLFAVLAYSLASGSVGDRLHVNHVDLVDVDLQSHAVRGVAWTHVYSPATQEFELSLQTSAPWPATASTDTEHLVAWQGLPGRGLGAVDTPATSTQFRRPYAIRADGMSRRDTAPLAEMPIEVAGSKSLAGLWWTEASGTSTGGLTVDSNGLLNGRLSNPLDIELSDCAVLYENWIYPLAGSLSPRESVSFDGISPRNLEWYLTRRRVVDTKDVGTPWDPMGTDVPRIMEVLMFYQAAGGSTYTGLTHRYQPHLDLSDHLRSGRAILVGRGSTPASQWLRGGQSLAANYDRHWAFYRLIFPVHEPEGP